MYISNETVFEAVVRRLSRVRQIPNNREEDFIVRLRSTVWSPDHKIVIKLRKTGRK